MLLRRVVHAVLELGPWACRSVSQISSVLSLPPNQGKVAGVC
jgi:hypothetical protein